MRGATRIPLPQTGPLTGVGVGMGASNVMALQSGGRLDGWEGECRTDPRVGRQAGVVFWVSGGPWDAPGKASGGPEPPYPSLWPLQQETRIPNHKKNKPIIAA